MAVKIIANIIFIVCLTAIQISFISGLPGAFGDFNLILVVLVFILGFASFNLALWWAVGAGLMLEAVYFFPFGSQLISLGLTVVIANFLLNYFFTNRSLYSFLALVALATVAHKLVINFIVLLFNQTSPPLFIFSSDFWVLLFEQMILNLLVTVFIYYLIHFFSRNLKPVFLIKSKKY